MAKGKGQGAKVVFDDRWVELYLEQFKELIEKGYSSVLAIVKLDTWALPKDFLNLITKAENAENLEALSDSEWKVYRVYKLALEDSPLNLKMHPNMGRPTKKTPEVEQLLILALQAGLTVGGACGYAGITEVTFYEWKKTDEEFSNKVETAKYFGKAYLELMALQGAGYSPKHALKILRVRFPDWQDKQEVSVSGDLISYLQGHASRVDGKGDD